MKLMKQMIALCTLGASISLLSGCATGETSSAAAAEPYGVAFSVAPEAPKLNESAALEVEVTKGKKTVGDADVVFEIWPKGADANSHYQANAKADGKGAYVLKGQFSEKGIYYLIAHVTPKETGQMTMASFDFEVE